MTEESKNNENDQPTEEQKPTDETQPELRKLSEKELKQILEEHKKWVESDGKEGKRANLNRADLQGVNLIKANLQDANLGEANLKKAKLQKTNLQNSYLWDTNFENSLLIRANLQGAELLNANLQGASLIGANLQDANLVQTNMTQANFSKANMQNTVLDGVQGLSEAKLQYANFQGATGLLGNEFAKADVTGTKLPDDIKEFKALGVVEKTSQNARRIFSAMLFGCFFSWLTIATTTDSLLLTNTATSPLPILGTEIPIVWFYITAPLVLIALYLYFHFYLQGLWEGLAGLPAIFPDGKRLDERAYPWLLNRLVRRHFKLLKNDRQIVAKLQELIVIILAWWVVPFTIFSFWFRYLVIHELIGTSFHIVLLLFSIAASLSFYQLCKINLQGTEIVPFKSKNLLHNRKSAYVLFIGFIFISLSIFGFNYWGGDFQQNDFSIKPTDYYKIDSVEKQIASVKGVNLRNRNLKNADMQEAFLVKADLRGASLNNADLKIAELQQANLEGANLHKANLAGADLRKANLNDANLHKANLAGADLRKANLIYANLQEAELQQTKLEGAKLQKAYLERANLQEAYLSEANLQEADLVGANLDGADLVGANLTKSNLENAIINNANFHSAVLSFSQLQNANLMYSDFYGAKLNEANFKGTIITSAIFGYSDLSGAKNLTKEQLCQTTTLFGSKLDSDLMEQVKKLCPQLLEDPGKEKDQTN